MDLDAAAFKSEDENSQKLLKRLRNYIPTSSATRSSCRATGSAIATGKRSLPVSSSRRSIMISALNSLGEKYALDGGCDGRAGGEQGSQKKTAFLGSKMEATRRQGHRDGVQIRVSRPKHSTAPPCARDGPGGVFARITTGDCPSPLSHDSD
jgi:hypothetical protein